jgi:uncharacterized protein (DUF58 family)
VTAFGSPKLSAYVVLATIALAGSLALGLPELTALAAPFALVLGAGLAGFRMPRIDVKLTLDRDRALQGEMVEAELQIESDTALAAVEIFVRLPKGLTAERNPIAVGFAPGERHVVGLSLRCGGWGGYAVGDIFLRTRDRLGLFAFETRADHRMALKVYPREEALRPLLRPFRTQALSGDEVARTKGHGIEFADMRPFVPGDQIRRVNWRASARRPALWVNESHPERNTDVVLFLDSFTDVRRSDSGTLDLAVRAAMSFARLYLKRHDRVGLVSFGGVLRWLAPSTGLAQLYRIVDALLDTEIAFSYAWKGIDVIPPRTLPPGALVIALTPLLDERSSAALRELRGQGFDLAVIEVSPLPFVSDGRNELEEIARRLWRLRREVARHRFHELEIPVAEWHEDGSLVGALEEVTSFRRAGRLVRV